MALLSFGAGFANTGGKPLPFYAAATAAFSLALLVLSSLLLRRRPPSAQKPSARRPSAPQIRREAPSQAPRPPTSKARAPAAAPRSRWRDCCCGGGADDEGALLPAVPPPAREQASAGEQAEAAPPFSTAAPGFVRQFSDVETAPSLRWPTLEEQAQADEIVALLTEHEREVLRRQPPDIQHVVFRARFLRGHGSVQASLKAFSRHLAFRESHADLLQRVRASLPPDLDFFDPRLLWASEARPFRYVSCLPTGLRSGLPMSFIPLSTVCMDRWSDWQKDDMIEFVISAAEMNCVQLHNRSMREHRMVKTIEVRDASGLPASASTFARLFAPFRHLMPIAGLYPELCHRLVLFNASPAVVRFIGWMRSAEQRVLRRVRREEKLRLIAEDDWEQLAKVLTARCMHGLAEATTADGSAPCDVAYHSAWLAPGASAQWRCSGGSAALSALFFPVAGGVQRLAEGRGCIAGRYTARSEGALVLVGANRTGRNDIRVDLHIDHT